MSKNENTVALLLAAVAKQLADLRRAFASLSKQAGPAGTDGKDGSDGVNGKAGRDGQDGRDGADGQDGQDGADGVDGKDGEVGPKPKHQWDGTKLRFEKPDGSWGKAIDLQGPAGKERTVRGPGAGGGGSAWDPSSLDLAEDTVPEEFIVRQDGEWVRATYAQMVTWLGSGGGIVLPAIAVVINGVGVTINGEQVVITESGAEQVLINGEVVTIDGVLVEVTI